MNVKNKIKQLLKWGFKPVPDFFIDRPSTSIGLKNTWEAFGSFFFKEQHVRR